jgi:hypothetical protein
MALHQNDGASCPAAPRPAGAGSKGPSSLHPCCAEAKTSLLGLIVSQGRRLCYLASPRFGLRTTWRPPRAGSLACWCCWRSWRRLPALQAAGTPPPKAAAGAGPQGLAGGGAAAFQSRALLQEVSPPRNFPTNLRNFTGPNAPARPPARPPACLPSNRSTDAAHTGVHSCQAQTVYSPPLGCASPVPCCNPCCRHPRPAADRTARRPDCPASGIRHQLCSAHRLRHVLRPAELSS